MRQIQDSDKRNKDMIEESKKNMELQVNALSEGMSTLQDHLSQLAQNHLEDKKQRENELKAIEQRFMAQHATMQAQTEKMADIGTLLAAMQSSLDAVCNRIPDENPTKTRQVEVTGR